jgi:hypothetical protein
LALASHSSQDTLLGAVGDAFTRRAVYQAQAKMTGNHPMQPSGKIGRFEVEDQPSPPADRNRYPTESYAAK